MNISNLPHYPPAACERAHRLQSAAVLATQLGQWHSPKVRPNFPRHKLARPLRSSSQSCQCIPSADERRRKKDFGFRTFSNSAHRLWNALSQILRKCCRSTVFNRQLKTHLFSDECWTGAMTADPLSLPPPPLCPVFPLTLSFLRCLYNCFFNTITATWAWLLHEYWALCKFTVVIIIMIIIIIIFCSPIPK